ASSAMFHRKRPPQKRATSSGSLASKQSATRRLGIGPAPPFWRLTTVQNANRRGSGLSGWHDPSVGIAAFIDQLESDSALLVRDRHVLRAVSVDVESARGSRRGWGQHDDRSVETRPNYLTRTSAPTPALVRGIPGRPALLAPSRG